MRQAIELVAGIIAILCILYVHEAHGETTVTATAASFHYNRGAHYNEFNPGLGIEQRFTSEFGIGVGFYRNSFHKQTNYIVASFYPIRYGEYELGLLGGILTGYTPQPSIAGAPAIRRKWDNKSFELIISPAALTFRIGVSFQ